MKARLIENPSFSNYKQEAVAEIGKVIVEKLDEQGVLKEKLGIAKEDLTLSNNTILYTTAVAGFIEQRLRPKLVAQNIIKSTTLNLKGQDSIKMPLRNALITATELPESGDITYDSGQYGGQTVTIKWIAAANKIPYSMLQMSNVDLMSAELGEIGDALARKIDSDIIASFDNACNSTNGNIYSVASGGTASFDDVLTAYTGAISNYAEPDVLLCDPQGYKMLLGLPEVKVSLEYKQSGVMPNIQTLLGLRLVISPQVPAKKLFFIDTKRTGYLVRGENVQTWDGRINSSISFEVIGAMAYGVGIVQPKSLYALDWSAL